MEDLSLAVKENLKTISLYKPERMEKRGELRGINTKSEVVERYVYKMNEKLVESHKEEFLDMLMQPIHVDYLQ